VNISKYEQRTLHALAQGGRIDFRKNDKGDIVEIDCFNRDGWRLADCTLAIFRKLRRRRLIRSQVRRRDYRPLSLSRASDRREFRAHGGEDFVLLARQLERGAAARAERDIADDGAKRGPAPLQRRLAGRTRLADFLLEHWSQLRSFTLTL
jgi:uncharacterized protein YjhX (UPF0386 family)